MLDRDQLEQNQQLPDTYYRTLRLSSWTICLLIGSFIPIPQVTPVTCEEKPQIVKSSAVLAQHDRKNGSADFYPARVMTRLKEAEAREAEPYYKQHVRQAWIILSFLQKDVQDAFARSSYAIYGRHPDLVWPSIVADRKALLGAEYYDWYDSADVLRPDVPKLSGRTAVGLADPSSQACTRLEPEDRTGVFVSLPDHVPASTSPTHGDSGADISGLGPATVSPVSPAKERIV